MQAATHLRVEWTALLLGVALAGLAVAGWQVDGGPTAPPAHVSLVTTPSDTLAVTPAGKQLEGTLRASDGSQGLASPMTVRNATGGAVAVRIKAEADSTALDEALLVRVSAKGQSVWEGPLGELRDGTPEAFVLQSHETTDVTVLTWIPENADEADWHARAETVRLSFLTEGTA
jgi:hypothetical protein